MFSQKRKHTHVRFFHFQLSYYQKDFITQVEYDLPSYLKIGFS